ncbi:MAG: pyrimidine/purine nucleoside phosphorylase [Verrucomicrobiales bacterium]
MPTIPQQFDNVSAVTKANLYFDGKVASHSLIFPDGSKKTLGLIYPGAYHFNTALAERMEIVDGACSVKLDGGIPTRKYSAGEHFDVGAKSGFTIEVENGVCQYICSFLS